MPTIDDCIRNALEQTKKQAILLEAQRRLLGNILYELQDMRKQQEQPCAGILKECLFNGDELFTLFYIHPAKHSEFETLMQSWNIYSYSVNGRSYFSLSGLIESHAFLPELVPLTLYYLSAPGKNA